MEERPKPRPVMCPHCGVPMNHHAEKLVEPTTREEAMRMNRALGGRLEEIHTCPECGEIAARPGD